MILKVKEILTQVVSCIKSDAWWCAALIRAIRTIAQAAIAAIGTAAVLGDVDWKYTFSAAILAGILSMLTSLAGLPEVEEDEE